MEKQPYEMTQKQYHEHVIRKTLNNYDCTRSEAEYCHPRSKADSEHYQICWNHVRLGGELRRQVLDSLGTWRRGILHDFPERHRWYVIPEARSFVGRATIRPTGIEVFKKTSAL